jgi:hypothetical protein
MFALSFGIKTADYPCGTRSALGPLLWALGGEQ